MFVLFICDINLQGLIMFLSFCSPGVRRNLVAEVAGVEVEVVVGEEGVAVAASVVEAAPEVEEGGLQEVVVVVLVGAVAVVLGDEEDHKQHNVTLVSLAYSKGTCFLMTMGILS